MSTNSYTNTDVLMRSLSRFVQTAGATPSDLEFYVEDAEHEIDGLLGGTYPMPFMGGSVPPLIRHMTRRLAEYGWLRSQIIQEDPSRSDWVEGFRTQVMEKIVGLQDGKMTLLSGSGTIIETMDTPVSTIWSNTMDFVPTMGLVSNPTVMRVDPGRVANEDEIRGD